MQAMMLTLCFSQATVEVEWVGLRPTGELDKQVIHHLQEAQHFLPFFWLRS